MEELEKELGMLELQVDKLEKEKSILASEIYRINTKIIELKWKDVAVCDLDYYEVRGGKCQYGNTFHGAIYCKNPYCRK